MSNYIPVYTETHVKRVEEDWKTVAKEEIKIELIAGSLYAFGSELATLRLYRYYEGIDDSRQGFSDNLKSYYFCLEGN